MAEDHNEEEQMIINQEYKIWKKEAPYKYDFLFTRSIEWPTSTFQWLPDVHQGEDSEYHEAVISANATDGDQCELQKVRFAIPNSGKCTFEAKEEQAYIKDELVKFQVVDRKTLGHEVNRSRYCPANPDVIASSLSNGEISIHYKNQIPLRLVCHTQQGFGLSWNPVNPTLIGSGQSDKRICIWDIDKAKSENNKIAPVLEIHHHAAPIEDVAWHKMHPNILASCSDDRMIMVWDLRFRGSGSCKPIFEIIAHTNEVYSLDFSPFNQFLFLSGSGDETVSLWDMRNLTRSLSNFKNKDSVVKVQWSPHLINLFGCCGYDRKVHLWDLSEIQLGSKEEQQAFFTHEGHRSRVVDFDWNQNIKLMVGSIEDSNCIHAWEIKHDLYYKQKE